MSDATEAQSTFKLSLEDDVTSHAVGLADSLEDLQAKVEGSEGSIKEMSATLRRLRGDSDDVKSAKKELNAAIAAERANVSAASIAIAAQGTSYAKLSTEAKKLAKQKEEMAKKNEAKDLADQAKGLQNVSNAAKGGSGPLNEWVGKFSELAEMATGAGGAIALTTAAVVAFTGAVVAASVALVGLVLAVGKWAIVEADANNALNLNRQAVTGSAEDAARLGRQVDLLASKVPTATAELNKMAVELRRNGIQGQTLVDTLNAEAQASSALGDSAGAKVKELVERSRMSKRFSVNPYELMGSGLKFDDIAKGLATATGKGVEAAKKALLNGQVSMADGAKALRSAIDKNFGEINLQKMFSFENIGSTFKKQFDLMTRGINLKPLYAGLKEIFDLFGQGSVTGNAMKGIIGDIGNGLIKTFVDSVPTIKQFIKGLVIGALEIELAYLTVRNYLRNAFGDSDVLKNIDVVQTTVTALKVAVYGTAAALALLGVAATTAFLVFGGGFLVAGVVAIYGLWEAGKYVYDWFAGIDWSSVGTNITEGIVNGIKRGVQAVKDAATGVADSIRSTFAGALEMRSPSRVMAEQGRNVSAGAAMGIEQGTPMVARAVEGMSNTAQMTGDGASSGGGSSGGARPGAAGGIVVHITVQGNADDKTVQTLSDSSFYAKMVIALEEASNGLMNPSGA